MASTRGLRPRGHPVFAAVYDLLGRAAEQELLGAERRRCVAACRGRVLEIGAGTGASFPYWLEAARAGRLETLVAVEPDPHMRRRAAARARRLGLKLELLPAAAEALPFPDASFDAVASFLVLCTVDDPARALAEVRRVLRPGGTLAFLEHVRASGGGAARWQRRLQPAWQRLAAGCRLDRDTIFAVSAAGFAELDYRTRRLPFPIYRLVTGTARRT